MCSDRGIRSKPQQLFYDTFDWRLFKKSLVLCRTGDEWTVRRLKTGADLERLSSELGAGLCLGDRGQSAQAAYRIHRGRATTSSGG